MKPNTLKNQMNKRSIKNHPLLCEEDHILKKKIKKTDICSPDEVIVLKGWFSGLYKIAQKFEKNPNDFNKAMLLGYISSTEFIVNKL